MGYEDSLLGAVNREAEVLHEKDSPQFSLELDRLGHIDATFADNTRLSSLLPKKVNIINTPEVNVPESRTHYAEDDSISRIDVALNYEWLQNAGDRGLAILCHELGHTVIVQQADLELQKLRKQFFGSRGLPKNSARTTDDVLLATQYSMQELGIHLDKELLAWDHGKSYKDLFGISDEIYESLEDRSIRAYVYNWTLSTHKDLERYTSRFGSLDSLKERLHGVVKVYDVSTRSYVEKSFSELVSDLSSFKDDEAKRLNDIASREVFEPK